MIIHFLHHWIYEDLWVPVWPNWFAGLVGFLIASVLIKRVVGRLHDKLDRIHRHFDIKEEE